MIGASSMTLSVIDTDFVATAGNIQFETANGSFTVSAVALSNPLDTKTFGIQIINSSGNIIGAPTATNLT